MKKMPVVFMGHGSPMNAISDNEFTRVWESLGESLEKPEGILLISAHWYTNGTKINNEEAPRQIYDMYGFPRELYEYRYEVKGSVRLAERVMEITEGLVEVDNSWGIDHGSWSVLAHLFPKADIPVVQLSIDRGKKPMDFFKIGALLKPLREEGILVIGSGNIVHNLRTLSWSSDTCSKENLFFDDFVEEKIGDKDFLSLIDYPKVDGVLYPDHYYPLLFILGLLEEEDKEEVFAKGCLYNSLSMTGYIFRSGK